MQIHIIICGKLKYEPALKELSEKYIKKMKNTIAIHEIDIKGQFSGEKLKELEAEKIYEKISQLEKKHKLYKIALDEKGKQFSSIEFADMVRSKQDQSVPILFIIGGAFGLANDIKSSFDSMFSLGKMTMPHLLASVFLVEQLYRAETIIEGHPYHKV